MTVSDLRKLLATLPDDMVVCMYASRADEMYVRMVETYPAGARDKGTLMLCDGDIEDSGAGSTVIRDERE